MEFKARECSDFLVRQLYYPYRHWAGRSSRYNWSCVRPFFVDFNLNTLTFRFFEYGFLDPGDYESITLVSARGLRVKESARPLRGLLDVPAEANLSAMTPQADNIERVLRVPFLVAQGQSNAFLVADSEGFTERQSSYIAGLRRFSALSSGATERTSSLKWVTISWWPTAHMPTSWLRYSSQGFLRSMRFWNGSR